MFLTYPQMQFPAPKGLVPDGASVWSAVQLASFIRWFSVTLAAPESEEDETVNMLISDPEVVIHALQESGREALAVQWARFDRKAKGWVFQPVEEVWGWPVGPGGRLIPVFRVAGEKLREGFGSVIDLDPATSTELQLLYKHGKKSPRH